MAEITVYQKTNTNKSIGSYCTDCKPVNSTRTTLVTGSDEHICSGCGESFVEQAVVLPGKKWNMRIRTYLAVSIPVTRIIFRCKNKACKHVWAYEYRKVYHFMGGPNSANFDEYYHEPAEYDLYRISDGEEKSVRHGICNECRTVGTFGSTETKVKGTQTEKACDDRCLHAKGADCECACGGSNHGKFYVIG